MNNVFKEVFQASSISIVVRFLGIPLGFLVHVILSRYMGLAEYGRYSIFISWSLILVIPVTFGLHFVALKYGAIYWKNKNRPMFLKVRDYIFKLVGLNLFIVTLFILCIYYIKPELIGLSYPWVVAAFICLIGSLSLIQVLACFLRSLGQVFLSQIFDQVLRNLILLLLLATVVFTPMLGDLNYELVVSLTVLAVVICLLLILYSFLKSARADMWRTKIFNNLENHSVDEPLKKEWLTMALPIFLIVVVQEVLVQGNVILIGSLQSPAEAGQYSIAYRLSVFVYFALSAANTAAAPMFAVAYKDNDYTRLQSIATITARLAFLAGAIIALIFIFFGPQIIALFGQDFGPAYPALCILIIGALVVTAVGAVGTFLTMTGHQNIVLRFAIIALIINLTLAFVLIPKYGLIGGAISATFSSIVFHVSQWGYIFFKVKLDPSVLGWRQESYRDSY